MKIGWIGTGVMGVSMAGHIQKAGHDLYVYNRSKIKADPLIEKGAVWCDSPADVAMNAEIIFTIVGFPQDVEEVYLGERGILSVEGRTRTVVDMTTSPPTLARKIAGEASRKGIQCLDAPVSGGDIGARDAKLSIMVGGDKETYERVKPLFEIMGNNISYFGEAGAGQHCKVCNQILVSGTMISVCESLLYAAKQGLNRQQVIDIVSTGAAGSWSITNLGPRIVRGDYKSGFYVDHFIKDMEIALQEAAAIEIALPGLALVHQLYLAVKAQGHGRSATQSLILALNKLCGGG